MPESSGPSFRFPKRAVSTGVIANKRPPVNQNEAAKAAVAHGSSATSNAVDRLVLGVVLLSRRLETRSGYELIANSPRAVGGGIPVSTGRGYTI